MKKKVLLSSIATIALCLCLITGATFALFTSTDEVNIVVKAGNVDMEAGIAITKLESVVGDVNGTIEDENGAKYSYSYSDVEEPYNFINGGTASVAEKVLTLTEVTPGDKITFEVSGTNTSDVLIQYRYKIDCVNGENLMKGLIFTVDGDLVDPYMETYTSPWNELAAKTNMENVSISVELPVTADNKFEQQETKIRVIVEAVQGNAVVEDNTDPVITYYNTAATKEDALEVITDPYLPIVNIAEDIAETLTIADDLSNKTIYANGNDVAFVFTGKLENVVIDGIVSDSDTRSNVNVSGAAKGSEITVRNSTFKSAKDGRNASIYLSENVNVTAENCVFYKGSAKGYGAYGYASADMTFVGCEFYDYTSWPVQINGQAKGNVTFDGCTFDVAAGVFKSQGSGIVGTFTFVNNTITAPGEKNDITKIVVTGSNNGPIVAEEVIDYGNTLNGDDTWRVPVANN